MSKRSKPWFVAAALARGDIDLVRAYGRRGAEARARKKIAQETEKIVDHEDDLDVQIQHDPTIIRTVDVVERKQRTNEEYLFGGL